MMNNEDMGVAYGVAQAIVAWGEAIAASFDPIQQRIAKLGIVDVTPARLETLKLADAIGVTDETFRALGMALRAARRETILLPPGRFEHLSRGKGWARKSQGSSASWGEREDGGYRVGPGNWAVGSSDGFTRKDSETWTVKHVTVGDRTWTVAS